MQRTVIVNGQAYTVGTRGADNFLQVVGPGIGRWPPLLLPEGTRIDDAGVPKLVRQEVRAWLRRKLELAASGTRRRTSD